MHETPSNPSLGTLAVTGANSYVGRHCIRQALQRGWKVLALARKDPGIAGVSFAPFDLENGCAPDALQGVSALVHLAWYRPDRPRGKFPKELNLRGTLNLLETARAQKIPKILFLSSQLASPGAKSFYAKSKFEAEGLFRGPREIVLRAGYVFGGEPSGFYQQTLATLEKAAVMPLVRKKAPLNPIHIDDLAEIIFRLMQAPSNGHRLYEAGSPVPVTLKEFLTILAKSECHKELRTVSLPVRPLFAASWILSWLSPKAMDLSERFGGLLSAKKMEKGRALEATAEFVRRGFRRPLLKEGLAFARYLFGRQKGWAAPLGLAKKYARGLQENSYAKPLGLPGIALRFPSLFALLEPLPFLRKNNFQKEFQNRLHWMILLEENRNGAKKSAARFAATLAKIFLKEGLFLPFRAFFHLTLRATRKNGN